MYHPVDAGLHVARIAGEFRGASVYERQKRLSKELEALLPRGPKGHPQNILRTVFYDSRLSGLSFTESFDAALAVVRKTHPDFMPNIRLNPLL